MVPAGNKAHENPGSLPGPMMYPPVVIEVALEIFDTVIGVN